MLSRTTIVRGLAFDIEVSETVQTDADGLVLFYLASIYVAYRRGGGRRLVRRTRIPGAGAEIAMAVMRGGVRALETLAH